jgi:hypothetical protein
LCSVALMAQQVHLSYHMQRHAIQTPSGHSSQ